MSTLSHWMIWFIYFQIIIPDDFPVNREGCLYTLLWVTLPAVFPGPDSGEDCTQMKSGSLCQDQVCPPDIQADHHLLWVWETPLCPSSFCCNFTNSSKEGKEKLNSNHWCGEKRFTHSFWIYIHPEKRPVTLADSVCRHCNRTTQKKHSVRFHVPAILFTPNRRRFYISGRLNENI